MWSLVFVFDARWSNTTKLKWLLRSLAHHGLVTMTCDHVLEKAYCFLLCVFLCVLMFFTLEEVEINCNYNLKSPYFKSSQCLWLIIAY